MYGAHDTCRARLLVVNGHDAPQEQSVCGVTRLGPTLDESAVERVWRIQDSQVPFIAPNPKSRFVKRHFWGGDIGAHNLLVEHLCMTRSSEARERYPMAQG